MDAKQLTSAIAYLDPSIRYDLASIQGQLRILRRRALATLASPSHEPLNHHTSLCNDYERSRIVNREPLVLRARRCAPTLARKSRRSLAKIETRLFGVATPGSAYNERPICGERRLRRQSCGSYATPGPAGYYRKRSQPHPVGINNTVCLSVASFDSLYTR